MRLILLPTSQFGATHIVGRIRDDLRIRYRDKSVITIDQAASLHELTDVIILVVESAWTVLKSQDTRPIDKANDPVVAFIEIARQSGLEIIPVLVGGAALATFGDLPPSLQRLNLNQAIHIRDGEQFDGDMNHLVHSLDHLDRYEARFSDLEPMLAEEKVVNDRKTSPEEPVEFGVAYPTTMKEAVPFLVDVWVFQPRDREEATSSAMQVRIGKSLFRAGSSASVQKGSHLTVQLQLHPWKVEPDVQPIVWTRKIASVSFRVTPDTDLQADSIVGNCRIFLDGLRIGQVFFELSLASGIEEPEFTPSKIINSAFACYAVKDSRQVLTRVREIEKVGVRVFADTGNLKSGAQDLKHLFREIDRSDVMYLFWSHHAKGSEWVTREWRYAMEQRGIGFIDPVPLVDPRKVTPPQEFAEKHFNDWTLSYSEYEKSLGLWHRFRHLIGAI